MKNFVKHNMSDLVNFGLLLLIFLYPKPKALEDKIDIYKKVTTKNEILMVGSKHVLQPMVHLLQNDTMSKYNSIFYTLLK
jgi:hypothetical protein